MCGRRHGVMMAAAVVVVVVVGAATTLRLKSCHSQISLEYFAAATERCVNRLLALSSSFCINLSLIAIPFANHAKASGKPRHQQTLSISH